LLEVVQSQPNLLASYLAPLQDQINEFSHYPLGKGDILVIPGDGEHPVANEESDTQGILDESGILIPPSEKRLHFRPRGQGNPLL
jgi:hypothetical protein